MASTSNQRPLIVMLLCVGIVTTAWFTPWRRLFESGPAKPDASRLDSRVETYCALRLADDWVALYELTDPRQRKALSRGAFLAAYDHKILTVKSLERKAVTLKLESGMASVQLGLSSTVRPENLPAEFRRGFQASRPQDLERRMDLPIEWVWRDGDWYFMVDHEIVSGRSTDGKKILPLDGQRPIK